MGRNKERKKTSAFFFFFFLTLKANIAVVQT